MITEIVNDNQEKNTSLEIIENKIRKLAQVYPEIYKITNPLDLFSYDEFSSCEEISFLAPSFHQLQKALANIKKEKEEDQEISEIDLDDILLGPIS